MLSLCGLIAPVAEEQGSNVVSLLPLCCTLVSPWDLLRCAQANTVMVKIVKKQVSWGQEAPQREKLDRGRTRNKVTDTKSQTQLHICLPRFPSVATVHPWAVGLACTRTYTHPVRKKGSARGKESQTTNSVPSPNYGQCFLYNPPALVGSFGLNKYFTPQRRAARGLCESVLQSTFFASKRCSHSLSLRHQLIWHQKHQVIAG